ncbi:hypothetical protein D3C81_1956310 [compost metagenome]
MQGWMKFQASQIPEPNQGGNGVEHHIADALQLGSRDKGGQGLRRILLVEKIRVTCPVGIADGS